MSQPTGQTIEIRNITDLVQLDERQLDACLQDLKTWVKFRREMEERCNSLVEMLRQSIPGMPEEEIRKAVVMQDFMGWVDDGEHQGGIDVDLHVGEEGDSVKLAEFSYSPEGKIGLTSLIANSISTTS